LYLWGDCSGYKLIFAEESSDQLSPLPIHFEIYVDEFKFLHLVAWGGDLVNKSARDIYKMQ